MRLYLGIFPLRSTATLAAVPAMSLIPIRSIRRARTLRREAVRLFRIGLGNHAASRQTVSREHSG